MDVFKLLSGGAKFNKAKYGADIGAFTRKGVSRTSLSSGNANLGQLNFFDSPQNREKGSSAARARGNDPQGDILHGEDNYQVLY